MKNPKNQPSNITRYSSLICSWSTFSIMDKTLSAEFANGTGKDPEQPVPCTGCSGSFPVTYVRVVPLRSTGPKLA